MKNVLSFLFVFSILLSCFSNTIIFIRYLSNQQYYAEVLCINKAKPQSHCNGHCQMKKQMQEQEKKEQNAPAGSVKDKNEVVYFYHISDFSVYNVSTVAAYNKPSVAATSDFPSAVFHPPAC